MGIALVLASPSAWAQDGAADAAAFGSIAGLHSALSARGLTLALRETSEVLANLTGGVRRGARYDGRTTMSLSLDTEKAFGWWGGEFMISALQIHGRSITADNLHLLQTASGNEADRATRLRELWYRQSFFDGNLDLRIGQQSLDREFMISDFADLFLNASLGWPIVPSADLYAGGPAYPLSSLGIWMRTTPTKALTLLAGAFDDNPPGGAFNDDSQLRGAEASGTAFHLGTGALLIAELQYAARPAAFSGLPGTYKLGAWFDTARFPDQRFDPTGLSLANPASTGIPRRHHGNFSLYAILDQTVWRAGPGDGPSLGLFLRAMGAPADRNLVDFGLNAGFTVSAPLPHRPDDSFGIGYGLARISGRAAALDHDTRVFTGMPIPIRSAEQLVEVTYQAQITPWWQVQPDFQYVFAPGGGIPAPSNPGQAVGDAAIIGLRTTINF